MPGPKRPNLVFVFPDQMRGHAVGFLGRDPVITPNLDKFAAESIVLTNAVSNWPVCSPHRAMLMTGMYPHRNRVLQNCTSKTAPYNCQLQESDRCWSDALKDRGYSLGYIGKWHLDSPKEPYIDCANNKGEVKWNEWCPPPRRHGFDFWYAYGTYDWHTRPMYWTTDDPREGFHYVDQWGPEHEADLAIRYIRNDDGAYRHPEKPFALVVAMNPPHMPYHLVPERYVEKYNDMTLDDLLNGRPNVMPPDSEWGAYTRKHIRNYFAMVTGVDEQFGRILSALRDAGLDHDTIVVFTSDHGDCLGIHGCISKSNYYDESLLCPFLIRWPVKLATRRDDLLLSTPDIYPTLLGLMGLEDDIPPAVQGTSHAGLFLTGDGPRPASALYMNIPVAAPAWGSRGVRTHRYTLCVTRRPGAQVEYVLHDNWEDPYQMRNIAAERRDVVDALIAEEMLPLLGAVGDPWISSGGSAADKESG